MDQPARKSAKDKNGARHFGPYGGRFVPETLVSALEELEQEYQRARIDPTGQNLDFTGRQFLLARGHLAAGDPLEQDAFGMFADDQAETRAVGFDDTGRIAIASVEFHGEMDDFGVVELLDISLCRILAT
jgi:hypothetical protein